MVLSPLEKDAQGNWQVRGFEAAKTLMNAEVIQAGFGAEQMLQNRRFITPPIPALDGEEHRERRTQIGKFFTPSAVNQQYYALIESFAQAAADALPIGREVDFKTITTQMASSVVCEVVGLTNSTRNGMVERFLYAASNHDIGGLSLSPVENWKLISALNMVFQFWFFDVRPAIQMRKNTPKHDLISHMLSRKINTPSIVVECLTYGLAGVLTTREFMSSALDLCLREPQYHDLMLNGTQDARIRFLYEVLRLNPVTSHLTRRASQDMTITSEGQNHLIRKGELIVFNIFEIDTDPRVLGDDALVLRPDRDFESRILWSMFAFGYGAHRCPGETLAIVETDILLQKLLTYEIKVIKPPTRGFNEPSMTNEVNNFVIRRTA